MNATAEAKTYNGWTNYETWAAALWMDNEEGSQRYWAERAQETFDSTRSNTVFTRREQSTLNLAAMLKDEHEEAAPELGASIWSDLLSAAMSEINWHEIAEHLIADIDEDA